MRSGRLWAETTEASDELIALVGAVSAPTDGLGEPSAGGMVTLPCRDGHPVAVLVSPARSTLRLGLPTATAMLLFADPAAELRADPRELSRAFGLTQGEAKLLAALSDGVRLPEYARQAGIKESTARDFLRKLFLKTGTGRQSDLVRLVHANPVLRRRR